MDWIPCLKKAIDYMEDNLLDIGSPEEVADYVNMSCMYLQNGFKVISGYSIGEYMRNRKLYLAAVELSESTVPVIDIALKYGYETPASFDKAFVRFHGVTPTDVRKSGGNIRTFTRLKISVSVQGGKSMQFRIEKKDSIRVVGFRQTFDCENSYEMIPKYWDEITSKYASHLMKGEQPADGTERYIADHRIGELGVCIDDIGIDGKFNYMIAGYYVNGEVPAEMSVHEIPAGDWAVFDCKLATLQDTNTAVWKEWLPTNGEYELAGGYNVEWYSPEGMPGPEQKCQLWYPVVRR